MLVIRAWIHKMLSAFGNSKQRWPWSDSQLLWKQSDLGLHCLSGWGNYSIGNFRTSTIQGLLPYALVLTYLFWCSKESFQCHGWIQRRGQGVWAPLKNHKNIGFLWNTSQHPLKNHKATKPAFNVGPSLARQRNAISMAFPWWADDGPFIAVFGSYIPSNVHDQIWTPSDKTFWIRMWVWHFFWFGSERRFF